MRRGLRLHLLLLFPVETVEAETDEHEQRPEPLAPDHRVPEDEHGRQDREELARRREDGARERPE